MMRRIDEIQMRKQEQILDGVVSVREVLAYVTQDCYLNRAETAKYLGISKRTIRDRLDEIPHYRFGSKLLLFKKSELDEWMGQFREGGSVELDELVNETLEKLI